MLEKFNFTPGVIIYNDFADEDDTTLNNDNECLKEDMFQVKYPNAYVIDVGWYSGIDKFIIFLIKDSNWENPIIKEICHNWDELDKKMYECILKVNNLINN